MIRVNDKVTSEKHFGGIVGRVSRTDIDDDGFLWRMIVSYDDLGKRVKWEFPEKNTFRKA